MVEVEAVETEQGFRALEHEWRELVCQCPDTTYYLTWEFNFHRWKYFSTDRRLWVLIGRDEDGTLVGIAPFAIALAKLGPLVVRRLEFICRLEIPFQYTPLSLDGEDLNVIAHPHCRDEVDAAFTRYLDRNHRLWDVVDLGWLSWKSRLRSHIAGNYRIALERTSPCATAVLPDDFSTFKRTVLGKSESKQISKDSRRLERDFPNQVRYYCIRERGEVAPALDGLEAMKSRRWDDMGEVMPDDDDPHMQFQREFDRDFALDAFDRGWVRIYQLFVGNDVIAADYNVVLHGTQYSLKTGFDPDWKAYSPGNVIQLYENAEAIEAGIKTHDYAHGGIDNKRKWSNLERVDVRAVAVTSWKGIPYFAKIAVGSVTGTYMRQLARRLLPERAFIWLRRTVRSRTQKMQRTSGVQTKEPDDQLRD